MQRSACVFACDVSHFIIAAHGSGYGPVVWVAESAHTHESWLMPSAGVNLPQNDFWVHLVASGALESHQFGSEQILSSPAKVAPHTHFSVFWSVPSDVVQSGQPTLSSTQVGAAVVVQISVIVTPEYGVEPIAALKQLLVALQIFLLASSARVAASAHKHCEASSLPSVYGQKPIEKQRSESAAPLYTREASQNMSLLHLGPATPAPVEQIQLLLFAWVLVLFPHIGTLSTHLSSEPVVATLASTSQNLLAGHSGPPEPQLHALTLTAVPVVLGQIPEAVHVGASASVVASQRSFSAHLFLFPQIQAFALWPSAQSLARSHLAGAVCVLTLSSQYLLGPQSTVFADSVAKLQSHASVFCSQPFLFAQEDRGVVHTPVAKVQTSLVAE
jgi:hypothetical protein